MDITTSLKFFVIGFSIAAPVGPIGVLCIRRTLADGRANGLATGLGAATADACYTLIAGLGITFVIEFLVGQQSLLHIVGGAFLLYLGVRTFLARPTAVAANARPAHSLPGAYFSSFLLTLSNPATILHFVAIFAGMSSLIPVQRGLSVIPMVLSIFCGSAFWWLILSGAVSLFRARIGVRTLTWVNRMAGIVICAFGLVFILI